MKSFTTTLTRLSAPITLAFLTLAPVAHAETGTTCKTATDATSFIKYCVIGTIDSVIVPLVFAIAFIVFLWGVYQYFIAGGANEEKRQQGQQFVLWSLIGFFIMFSIWGLVNVLTGTFGFSSAVRPQTPLFDQSNASANTGGANSATVNTGTNTGGAGAAAGNTSGANSGTFNLSNGDAVPY